jgi:glycosyltransferase involved in cell wall biosynthesis
MTIAVVSMIRDAWGGSEELWYEMAKVALKQGHKVIHVSYETPDKHHKTKELEALGLVRILRPGWVPPNAPAFIKFAYLTKNYLRKKLNSPIKKLFGHKPDIVLYNGTCYSIAKEKELLKCAEASSSSFFIIGHFNNERIKEINDAEAETVKQGYRLSKKVFFVSERNLETAVRHLCTTIPNAEIIRNPVNLSSTDPLPFPPVENTIQFACVGNLVTVHKGQDILIVALSKWQQKNWTLNIYGNGPDKVYLQNLSAYLGLEKQIIFHGTVTDIRQIWKQNQALLMPSHMEGMPLAVVEAMLCGRICIATDVGGHKEWITHSKNGFLAEAATIPCLLKSLDAAYAQRESWEQMGADARQTALKLYDPYAGTNLLNRIIAE